MKVEFGPGLMMGLALVVWVGAGGSARGQAVILVDARATGAGDGSSWADAYPSVQPALDAATNGQQVWVAAGRYVGTITLQLGVGLYGGFGGAEDPTTFDLGERDLAANETILDGNQEGSVVTGPQGADATTRIDGFTITNGRAFYGGGLYLNGSSPTVVHNTIKGNSAPNIDGCGGDGGGLYLAGSSAMITSNTITGNRSRECGGGLYVSGGAATIASNTIRGNTGSYGGGVYLDSASPLIASNVIAGNSVTVVGGGLGLYRSSPILVNNTILGNGAPAFGGGLHLISSSPTIANNTIMGNNTGRDGGGVELVDSSPIIANNIVALNSSGIGCFGGTPTLRHNCVFGNAVYNYYGIGDPTGISGNISVDPRLADPRCGDAHIEADSPCVDAGSNALAVGDFDLDHGPRVVDGDGDGAAVVDMGAYEYAPTDCNGNGVSDAVDIFQGASPDCNTNRMPDECELAAGTSMDCNTNGLLDECELAGCDCNSNGVPDECEQCGDLDGDGDVDAGDYAVFRRAYGHSAGEALFNACCDYDGSGTIGLKDYQAWLACYREFVGGVLAGPRLLSAARDPGRYGTYGGTVGRGEGRTAGGGESGRTVSE